MRCYYYCESGRPIYSSIMRYNAPLRKYKADDRLQSFYLVVIGCWTLHDLLMWTSEPVTPLGSNDDAVGNFWTSKSNVHPKVEPSALEVLPEFSLHGVQKGVDEVAGCGGHGCYRVDCVTPLFSFYQTSTRPTQ